MQLLSTSSRYGGISQGIHWVTAALVIVLLVSGKGEIEAEESSALYYWDSSLGLLVLLLVLARIIWRFVTPAPTLPASMSGMSGRIATGLHAMSAGRGSGQKLAGHNSNASQGTARTP